ncbi:DUF1127 domain-containing protein [Roseovarius arcticus]|uniref:DUF1127 domain-containing protein n=1 Tax=Roseovarius arcticus TaxID=2547404 RepID=UPI0011108050|nr:DUF1127 domain-containing protein [Roseovarius arcticus]
MAASIKQVAHDVRRFASVDFHRPNWAAPLGAALVRMGAGTVRWLASLMYTVQLSRMVKVLYEMNDRQLAEIGIKRTEIPAYAETLMTDHSD